MGSRKVRIRRISPVSDLPVEGPLTEPISGVQPVRLELVFMPHSSHCCQDRNGEVG